MRFRRPEHVVIAEALGAMDAEWLLACRCFFGGGTAVVLKHGEYRLSRDIDFLCADADGYRELRMAAVRHGVSAFFGPRAEVLREMRADQYGLRTVFGWSGEPIKFEVVREARIPIEGAHDRDLGVPLLSRRDQFAEKLLANADRCYDRAVACRDAVDLGFLLTKESPRLPAAAVAKAEAAYGSDVAAKVGRALWAMRDGDELGRIAGTLQMTAEAVEEAHERLRAAAVDVWPLQAMGLQDDGPD